MNVTLIGLGKMGGAMARRLLGSGHALTVFNRTTDKAAALAERGAKVETSAAAAIGASPAAILMLPDAEAIDGVLFPAAGPALPFAGRTIIQMGTISPAQSLELAGRVEAAGGAYLEAPVLGGPADAEAGRLHILVGATPQQYERWRPLLAALSPAPLHAGPVGRGAALKLALNQILAAEAAALAFSLALVRRNGIEVDKFLEVLRSSSLYTLQFEKKLPNMLGRTFQPASFSVRHLLKDVRLAADEGRRVGLDTSSVDGLAGLANKAVEAGQADADYSAIYAIIDPAQT